MIFVTVGTHHQPFDRLIAALDGLGRSDLVVQHGHSAAPTQAAAAAAFISFGQMEHRMQTADAVVTHAGVGSILLAIRCGHTPIVVPRLRQHGEHVDDHQSELATALGARGQVVVVEDLDELGAVLSEPPPRRPAAAPIQGDLHAAVRAALRG